MGGGDVRRPGRRSAITSPARGPCAGPSNGTTRIPAGTPNMCSQACEMTLDQRPPEPARCAYSPETESVSTAGDAVTPSAAKHSSMIRRLRIRDDSRHSGSAAACAQRATGSPAGGASAGPSSR